MIIAVDFDGTLCENNYPGIGAPKLNVINTIKKMQAEGHEFILWTCRVDDLLNDALKFLEDYDLHFSKINQDSDLFLDKYEGRPRKIGAHLQTIELSLQIALLNSQNQQINGSAE